LKLAFAAGLSTSTLTSASVGLDEFLIEGRQIKLLFRFWNRLILRQAGPDIILDANPERPNMGLLPGHDLQQANLGNFAHLRPSPNLPASRPFQDASRDQQVEGMEAPFDHEPAHGLFRRYVDWIGFHHQLLLIVHAARLR
jgi:hypothetical protein